MGTALSVSPISSKTTTSEDGGEEEHEVNGKMDTSLKKHVIVSTLMLKRLVTATARTKSGKRVDPTPPSLTTSGPQDEENNTNLLPLSSNDANLKTEPLAVPIPMAHAHRDPEQISPAAKQLGSVQKQPSSFSLISPRRVIVQASTGELLRCLGEFICKRCFKVKELSPTEVIFWFRNLDRTLLLQGWQDYGFITPANLVFVYLMCRETVTDEIDCSRELQRTFLTCLYLSYSYIGNEISYPLKPFLIDTNEDLFWECSLDIIDRLSGKMLQINMDPRFFTEVFQDLKSEGDDKKEAGEVER